MAVLDIYEIKEGESIEQFQERVNNELRYMQEYKAVPNLTLGEINNKKCLIIINHGEISAKKYGEVCRNNINKSKK